MPQTRAQLSARGGDLYAAVTQSVSLSEEDSAIDLVIAHTAEGGITMLDKDTQHSEHSTISCMSDTPGGSWWDTTRITSDCISKLEQLCTISEPGQFILSKAGSNTVSLLVEQSSVFLVVGDVNRDVDLVKSLRGHSAANKDTLRARDLLQHMFAELMAYSTKAKKDSSRGAARYEAAEFYIYETITLDQFCIQLRYTGEKAGHWSIKMPRRDCKAPSIPIDDKDERAQAMIALITELDVSRERILDVKRWLTLPGKGQQQVMLKDISISENVSNRRTIDFNCQSGEAVAGFQP